MRKVPYLIAAALLVASHAHAEQAISYPLIPYGNGENNPGWSRASAISADGKSIVGSSDLPLMVAWSTPSAPTSSIFFMKGGVGAGPYSSASAVSADGSVIVGHWEDPGVPTQAFMWTTATGAVPLSNANGSSLASGVSANGSVIVGSSLGQAFRWTSGSGIVPLGVLPGSASSEANGVSADGTVVVGDSTSASGNQQAFRWTASGGMVSLGNLPGATNSVALAVSGNG